MENSKAELKVIYSNLKYDASKLEFSKSNLSKMNITTKTVDTTKNYVQENWKAEQKFHVNNKY